MTKSLIDPWLGLEPPKELAKIYEKIGILLDRLDAASPVANGGASLRSHLGYDRLPRVAYPMRWMESDTARIDRVGTMLSGLPFTSDEFPWPRLTSCSNVEDSVGTAAAQGFCEPLIQLDLQLASRSSGFEFPESLVQVWMDDQEPLVRVIAKEAIADAVPSVPDEKISEFFSSGEPTERNTYRDWPAQDKIAPWLQTGFAYVGLSHPIHEFPETIEYFLEDISSYDLQVSDTLLRSCDEEALELRAALMQADGMKLLHGSPSNAGVGDDEIVSGSLFGRFRSVQKGAFDLFDRVAMPVIDVGCYNPIFYWRYGDAQLLTPSDVPGSELVFDWSTS